MDHGGSKVAPLRLPNVSVGAPRRFLCTSRWLHGGSAVAFRRFRGCSTTAPRYICRGSVRFHGGSTEALPWDLGGSTVYPLRLHAHSAPRGLCALCMVTPRWFRVGSAVTSQNLGDSAAALRQIFEGLLTIPRWLRDDILTEPRWPSCGPVTA